MCPCCDPENKLVEFIVTTQVPAPPNVVPAIVNVSFIL